MFLKVYRNFWLTPIIPTFLFIGSVVIFLATSEVILRFVYPSWNEYGARFFTEVSEPGHGNFLLGVPGFNGYFSQNNGDFRTHLYINQAGLRNDEPVQAADGRIWIIGDSMAFGWGVERGKIYTARLEEYSGQPTFNVAAPGGDLCSYQGLLSRMPSNIKPKAVVLGLLLENDVLNYNCRERAVRQRKKSSQSPRKISVINKSWLTNNSATYNFITNSLKRAPFINRILVKLGLSKASHGYSRICSKKSMKECVSTTLKEMNYLKKMLPLDVPFVVLVAASRFEIRDNDQFYRRLRLCFLGNLKEAGIDYVDTFSQFRSVGFEATHFKHDGHWVPLGHEIAGRLLAKWFKNRF